MNKRTYIRAVNTAILDRCFILSVLKKIVTFYYNSFVFHPNIFKNYEKVPNNTTEHKNCLAFLKAVDSANINFIY